MSGKLARVFAFALLALLAVGLMPSGLSSAAPSPTQTNTGRIIYLAADGRTIKSVRPDGTGGTTIFTVTPAKGLSVHNLTANQNGSAILFTISEEKYDNSRPYYLLAGGKLRKLPAFMRAPRWSPDGKRFVAQLYTGTEKPGSGYVYNVTNNTFLYLPFAGLPDWYPDGTKYVYTDGGDIFSFNRATNAVTRLTNLPHDDATDNWEVLEAHVTPDGKRIVFFGQAYIKDGQFQLGASGNGLQWYSIPVAGGTPEPWLEPEGNGLVEYAASVAGNRVAYAANAHVSACAGLQTVVVLDASAFPGSASFADIPDLDEKAEQYAFVNGLTWSPDGASIAYGVRPYSCADPGGQPSSGTPTIYVAGTAQGTTAGATLPARKLVNGTNPVWVRSGLVGRERRAAEPAGYCRAKPHLRGATYT